MKYSMPMTEGRELPQITFRENDLPEVVNLEVGDSKYLVMKVEMVAKHSGKYTELEGSDQNKIEGTFKVTSVRCLGYDAIDAKTLESEEFSKVAAKIKSGEL